MKTIVASFLIVTVTTTAGMGGSARAADGGNTRQAQQLLDEGVAARAKGDSKAAVELFERAKALVPSPKSSAQLGLAQVDLGLWEEASSNLAEALASSSDAWIKKNRRYLETAAGTVAKHLGKVAVAAPADAEVTINGKRVDSAVPVAVKEGAAHVVVKQEGFLTFTKSVDVHAGETVNVVADLVPDRKALPIVTSAPPPAVSSDSPVDLSGRSDREEAAWRKPVAFGLIGAGAAAIAAGVVLFVVDDKPTCDAPTGKMCDQLYDTRTSGLVALAGGALAAATGGWLLYDNSRRKGVSVAATVSGLGIGAAGKF